MVRKVQQFPTPAYSKILRGYPDGPRYPLGLTQVMKLDFNKGELVMDIITGWVDGGFFGQEGPIGVESQFYPHKSRRVKSFLA